MALNAYLQLKLNGSTVQGSVTQKGREGQILVRSLEWSFESDGGNLSMGEVKWIGDVDKATTDISHGLDAQQNVDAVFNFWTPDLATGSESNYFRLTGANGKITSVDLWLPNTLDPSVSSHPLAVQVTMSFQTVTELFVSDGTSAIIST